MDETWSGLPKAVAIGLLTLRRDPNSQAWGGVRPGLDVRQLRQADGNRAEEFRSGKEQHRCSASARGKARSGASRVVRVIFSKNREVDLFFFRERYAAQMSDAFPRFRWNMAYYHIVDMLSMGNSYGFNIRLVFTVLRRTSAAARRAAKVQRSRSGPTP